MAASDSTLDSDLFEEAAVGAFMSLPTASFHTEFDASTILSGAVTRHSRHRAPSVAVAASAVTLSNIADRLIDECSTFSEIYYYEDADERQHPLFVQPPPTAEAPRESIDSQSTTQQHPSVYSSSAGEVSSAAALRTSSIDARTAALEAKLNLDALSAGRRPTPRLLSPADVEIDHARLPEVTWSSPSSPDIVSLLSSLYAFLPNGVKLPDTFSCFPLTSAHHDAPNLDSLMPTTLTRQLIQEISSDRALQHQLLQRYVDHKTTVASLLAAATSSNAGPLGASASSDNEDDDRATVLEHRRERARKVMQQSTTRDSAFSPAAVAARVASFFSIPSFLSSTPESTSQPDLASSSASFSQFLSAPAPPPQPVPVALRPVQFGLRALYARYLTRLTHALRAKQSFVHLLAVMTGWCIQRLRLDIVEWQDGGYVSLVDMAHALYETELRRLALLKESTSLHIALLLYQLHAVNKLLQRSEHEIVFAWEGGALCLPDGTLLEFAFVPDARSGAAADFLFDRQRLQQETSMLADSLPPGLSSDLILPHSSSSTIIDSAPPAEAPMPDIPAAISASADAAISAAMSSLFAFPMAFPAMPAPVQIDQSIEAVPESHVDQPAKTTTLLAASPFAQSLSLAAAAVSAPKLCTVPEHSATVSVDDESSTIRDGEQLVTSLSEFMHQWEEFDHNGIVTQQHDDNTSSALTSLTPVRHPALAVVIKCVKEMLQLKASAAELSSMVRILTQQYSVLRIKAARCLSRDERRSLLLELLARAIKRRRSTRHLFRSLDPLAETEAQTEVHNQPAESSNVEPAAEPSPESPVESPVEPIAESIIENQDISQQDEGQIERLIQQLPDAMDAALAVDDDPEPPGSAVDTDDILRQMAAAAALAIQNDQSGSNLDIIEEEQGIVDDDTDVAVESEPVEIDRSTQVVSVEPNPSNEVASIEPSVSEDHPPVEDQPAAAPIAADVEPTPTQPPAGALSGLFSMFGGFFQSSAAGTNTTADSSVDCDQNATISDESQTVSTPQVFEHVVDSAVPETQPQQSEQSHKEVAEVAEVAEEAEEAEEEIDEYSELLEGDDDDFILDDFYFHPLAPVEQFNFDLFLCDQRYAEGQTFVNWLQVLRAEVDLWTQAQLQWKAALESEWLMRQALRLQLARACASRLQRRAQRNTELAMQKLAIAKQAAEQQEQLHRQALHDVALVLDELIADSVESIEFPDVARAKIEHKRALEQARQEKETADAEQRALLLQLSQKPVNELSLDEMFLLATREDLSVEDTVSHETRRVADVPSDKGVGEDVDEMAALSMLEAHEAQAEHREQMELQRWQSQALWLVDLVGPFEVARPAQESLLTKAMLLPVNAARLLAGMSPNYYSNKHSDEVKLDRSIHVFGPVELFFGNAADVARRRSLLSRQHILQFLSDFSLFLARKIDVPLHHTPSLRLDLERAVFPRLERMGSLKLFATPAEIRDDAAFRQQCVWLTRLSPSEVGLHPLLSRLFSRLPFFSAANASASAWLEDGTIQTSFPFSRAVQILHSCNYLRAPSDLMNCMLRTVQAIAEQARSYFVQIHSTDSLSSHHLVLDADTLFPLVLWVVIHARLQQSGPHFLLAHIDRFSVMPEAPAQVRRNKKSERSGSGEFENAGSAEPNSNSQDSFANYGACNYARTLIEASIHLVVTITPSQLFLSEHNTMFHQQLERDLLNAAAVQANKKDKPAEASPRVAVVREKAPPKVRELDADSQVSMMSLLM